MAASGTGTRVTDLARVQARRNEQLVLAENALVGERRVAVTRFVMALLFALSSEIVPRIAGAYVFDPATVLAGASYGLFALITIVKVARATPNPRRSLWIPNSPASSLSEC